MAKKTVGKVKKIKRPGQSIAARNSKIAIAEYSDIASAPFDLKALVASVKSANTSKIKAKKKNTEAKAEVQELRIEETQLQTQILNEETQSVSEDAAQMKVSNRELRKKLAEAKKAAKVKAKSDLGPSAAETKAAEDVRLFGVMVGIYENSEALSAKQLTYLSSFYDKALSSVTALVAGSSPRIILFKQLMELAQRFRKLRVSQKPSTPDKESTQKDQEKTERSDVKDKLLGSSDRKPSPWKTLTKALKLVGGKATNVVGAARPISSAVSASTSMIAVKSIAKVSDGLKFVGRKIEETGTGTLKWVGSKLSDLTSRVMGMLRSAKNFLTGGGTADFLSMGAIALGILPTLVEGLVDELKKRFGENFVMGFISEKWDATKKFVTEFLSDFIDKAITMIKNLPETLKNLGSKAWDGAKKAGSNLAHVAKEMLTPDTPERKAAKERLADKESGKVPPLRQFTNMIDEYDGAKTQAQKDEIAVRMTQLVNATPSLKSETRVINAMKSRGININAKVNNATNTSTTTANVGAPQSGGNTTTVSAPTSNTNVSVTPPAASSGSNAPVIAEKPSAPPGGSSGGSMDDAGSASSTVSNGLNNASVPNNAADETLTFMNLASMGA